jgi:hypothetical protein
MTGVRSIEDTLSLDFKHVLVVELSLVDDQQQTTWEHMASSHMTTDALMAETTTFDPLTPEELVDVETSRTEIADGNSKKFRSLEDTITWLNSE